ncbi:MAG: isochorismatase family protein [Promethearchaeota archaeon]
MQKEDYLTLSNHDVQIEKWRNLLFGVKKHRRFKMDYQKLAILILDMQDYFLDPLSHAFVPSSTFILEKIKDLINFGRSHDILIIFTRHLNSQSQPNMMNRWWRDFIEDDNQYSKINASLNSESNNSQIITKNTYSAFRNTDLNQILEENNISQLIISGVMTHLCCETTARDAFLHDYEVFFLMDATATYTEDLHIGSLRSIHHGFGEVCTVKEVLSREI